MNLSQLFIGFSSGFIIGLAVGTHAFSRAVVFGLIAGAVVGGIAVDGAEGYVNWAAYLLAEMAKFAAFWGAMTIGFLGGAVVARVARAPNIH